MGWGGGDGWWGVGDGLDGLLFLADQQSRPECSQACANVVAGGKMVTMVKIFTSNIE